MKKIVLIALTALALGLASIGVGTSAIASIRSGTSGDFEAKTGAPALAGGRVGGGGEVHAGVGAPDVASIRGGATGDFEAEVAAPRFSVSGGMSGGVLGK